MTSALHKIWCDEDEHYRYEHFADFNEWLDGDPKADKRNSDSVQAFASVWRDYLHIFELDLDLACATHQT